MKISMFVYPEIEVWALRGKVELSQSVELRPLPTVPLRGILGHALKAVDPLLVEMYFKPGADGSRPPAFILQPILPIPVRGQEFFFDLYLWGDPSELEPGLRIAFFQMEGAAFSGKGASIRSIQLSEMERIQFEGLHQSLPTECILHLKTPLCLKTHDRDRNKKRPALANEIDVSKVLMSLASRVRNLVHFYGAGEDWDPSPYLEAGKEGLVLKRKLKPVCIRRNSSARGNRFVLNGYTGALHLGNLEPLAMELATLGSLFHVGHHTQEGCGMTAVEVT